MKLHPRAFKRACLIHGIYKPGHHSNQLFYSALRNGVQQQHWPYGNMSASIEIGFSEMAATAWFVREVQLHNGIVLRE